MNDETNRRKTEHLDVIAKDAQTDRRKDYFDGLRLRHRALPELDFEEVDPSISLLGRTLSFPLLISSMTGGESEQLRRINTNLAIAAEACRVAMGVGSQRVQFESPGARSAFALRKQAPHALLFANLGAVQLNYGFGIEQCREAVETVGADGLFLHLNPLQEIIQPEGDTRWSGLADRIGAIAAELEQPVILKEVGAGLSPEDAELAVARGIRYLDVAGSGGLSWSRIEHHRRAREKGDDLGLVFQDWGIPTPLALQLLAPLRDRLTLFASGGIRTGVDMAKAMVLGASLCGMASPFLEPARKGPEGVIALIERLKKEFTAALFLLGIRRVSDLVGNASLLL